MTKTSHQGRGQIRGNKRSPGPITTGASHTSDKNKHRSQDPRTAREIVRLRLETAALRARAARLEARQGRLNHVQSELEMRVRERTSELAATVSDLEAFSYSISHDLRAPLRAMEGYAQLLQQKLGGKVDPVSQDFLNRISTSAQRLDALIQDVLKYSRVARAPLELGLVDLEKLVEGIIKDYPNLQPPKAEVEVRKPLCQVMGNEAFLTQCISNLLSNGVKFVKPGEHPRVCVWTQDLKHGVRVCFEDNGIGVAPENHHRIFGIFQRMHSQNEYEGTGIGLAIVKKAAERMGGQVGMESTLGKGSRFWLELPRA